jgi:hypothetical protein
MRSTDTMASLWGPPKQSSKMGWFVFWSGARVFVRVELHPALAEMNRIMKRWNYSPDAVDTGGYNPRYISGTTTWSLHAYGIAVDVNWQENPAGGRLVTDMPRAMVEEIEAMKTNDGLRVWRWGGDWDDNNIQDESFYDAMHFEAQASPAELRAGIRTTAPAPEPEPEPEPPKDDDLMLIIHADDRKSRLITPMSITPLDNLSLWNLAVAGVKQAKVSAPVFDAILKHAVEMLNRNVVTELQQIEADIEALDQPA